VKFKISEKSLFAVLLRSPWWYSLALGVAVIAVSRALLSNELWIFGAMGGVPFLVISCIALYRQRHRMSESKVTTTLETLSQQGWKDFSAQLEAQLRRHGYQIESSAAGAGADYVLSRQGRVSVLSAKRWKAAQVSEADLQALKNSMNAHEARDGLYLSMGRANAKVLAFAQLNRIAILSNAPLAEFVAGRTKAG
jgi:restriction system protein